MLNAGDRFGDYTVVRLLGEGGMGAVFLMESDTGAQVAAKILDPKSAGDHEARRRFVREAQLALGVKHANLVETYDVGEDPETGLCYILMEYVSGGSLADRIKAGPLAIDEAVRITCQIASVLELARQKGIVHRDIKPANIMFDADGTAKLADLGIARSGIGGTETTTVTQTGMMIGTPAYMAPEQMLNAHNVDCRADIYSLGIVFYEMLTGERPNKDDTAVQLMAKAVAGRPIPDVRRLRPEISASIAELVNLMCAMKVDERIATPAEVATAIAQIAHGREVTVRRKAPAAVRKTSAPQAAGSRKPFPWKALIPVSFLSGLAVAFAVLAPMREQTVLPSVAKPVEPVVQTVVRTNVVEKIVEKEVMADVRSRTNARIEDGVYRWKGPEGDWTYRVRNGLASIGDGQGCALYPRPRGRLTIPATISGLPVEGIAYGAFQACKDLTAVEISEGILEIDCDVFKNCSSLQSIRFPASVRRIGAELFSNCSSLRTVAFDGDAPELADDGRILRGRDIFRGTPHDLVVIVKRGSRGWSPNGDGLPESWPVGAGNNARRIRYADEEPAPARTGKAIDPSRLQDKEPARAVQKTLDALFPGWKVRAISSSDRKVGFLTEFRGRRNLLVTHPPHVHEPAVLWRTVSVPRADPVLLLELSGDNKLSDFRLEVRVDGQSVRTEDVSGADGFVRFVVDLGRWAGRQVPIEVLHRPTGWNWEWAYWSRIEILSSKGLAQSQEAKAKPLRPIMDYAPFLDSDDTRAVQKALDILAPGWKTSKNRSDGSIGFYEEFKHRYNVIKTHPPARGQPVVLTRQQKLVGSNPKLRLGVVNDYNADFHLAVRVDGTEILSRNVEGYEWKDIELDLSKWSGKDVRIEVVQMPTGWRDERAYWSKIAIE